jgi:hypothetical protein
MGEGSRWSRSTGCTVWVISTVECAARPRSAPARRAGCREILDLFGERREKSRFAVSGSSARDPLDVPDETMSSIRSALVQHEDLDLRQVEVALAWWSSMRPGVATRMSTPRLNCVVCAPMPTPPNITIDVSFAYLP